jgi:transposase
MGKQRRRFSKEFKLEAIRLLKESGKTRKQIAEDLGVSLNTLDRWRMESSNNPAEAFRGNGKRTVEQERIWQLEREVETLKREREILKKTLVIISQP